MTDINALVGRKIGLEPVIVWIATDDGGKSSAMSAWPDHPITKCDVEAFCAAYSQYKLDKWEHWPDFEHVIAAAWLLVEWMTGHELHFGLTWNGSVWSADFTLPHVSRVTIRQHSNTATAIFRAFCAANGIAVPEEVQA